MKCYCGKTLKEYALVSLCPKCKRVSSECSCKKYTRHMSWSNRDSLRRLYNSKTKVNIFPSNKSLRIEYEILRGLAEDETYHFSLPELIRLEALAENFGRDIEEWLPKRIKEMKIENQEMLIK